MVIKDDKSKALAQGISNMAISGDRKDVEDEEEDPTERFLASLPKPVLTRVTALQDLQTKHNELHEKFLEERKALLAKYLKLYEPIYSERAAIVNGAHEPAGVSAPAPTDPDADIKGVPGFWLGALMNNEVIASMLNQRDEAALKYLADIRWSQLPEGKGFKLEFSFSTNPYFKDTVLSKTYYMIDEDEPILEKAEGTEIDWFPGKNLTVRVIKRKAKKGGKNAKMVTKTEQCDSFFNFFSPPAVPSEDDEMEEEDVMELQGMMEEDYEVGATFKEKIIPDAVSWFTGEAADIDDEDDDEDDEDEDGEDEDEEEDEEDEEEDEEMEQEDKKTKAKKPSKKGGKPAEQPPECKQQ